MKTTFPGIRMLTNEFMASNNLQIVYRDYSEISPKLILSVMVTSGDTKDVVYSESQSQGNREITLWGNTKKTEFKSTKDRLYDNIS